MVGTAQFNLEEFRVRLQKMSDAELIRLGKAAAYMPDPKNGPIELTCIWQLNEARCEWRQRYPKP